MADTPGEASSTVVRVALAVALTATLAVAVGVTVALAANGPPSALVGALSLAVGIVTVAGLLTAFAASGDAG